MHFSRARIAPLSSRLATLTALALLLLLVATAPRHALAEENASALEGRAGQRIVNGIETTDYPTTVALISSGGSSFCTGTLIGCSTVLTASHCVCASTGANCDTDGPDLSDPSGIRVFAQSGGIFGVSSIDVPPGYVFGSTSDVAILHLDGTVNGIPPTPINTTGRLAPGTTARLVGFGLSQGDRDDTGVKRYGDVSTATCTGVPDSKHVCWNFENPIGTPGEDSNTCPGDSGGPLFWNDSGTWTVAGVTSGGVSNSCLPPDASFDADVYVERTWIQAQGGADLANTSCGALPQVGSSIVEVQGTLSSLSAQTPDRFFNFDVPQGAQHLRVTLNGEDGTNNDFDLYVRQGAAPTDDDYDCRPFKDGNPEACDFATPTAGTWYARVNRFAGAGAFQTTVTLFGVSASIFEDGFESGNKTKWSSEFP